MTDRSTQVEPTRLTAETQHRLQAELEDLMTRGRVEIAQAIETARALGDLSENGDYHAAKDSQGKMESRIRQLSALLKNVELVETGGGDGTVAAGSTVTLRYEGDDEDDVQRFFVGSIEEHHDGMSVVSPSAPLGLALLGHKAGETVEYKAPAGPLRVVIVKVGD
jgi:transcription elongation factor GreA